MKHITINRLEKILISLIKKVDHRASNIRVATAKSSLGQTSMIKVDHVDKDFPELDKFNIDWISFGINQDGKLFYHVDGLEGRYYFGEQDYSADLQIAWSFIQQQLHQFGVHSESKTGHDGSVEIIVDGTLLDQKDLEENVFDRKPSEAVRKAYSETFYKDFPECREERANV